MIRLLIQMRTITAVACLLAVQNDSFLDLVWKRHLQNNKYFYSNTSFQRWSRKQSAEKSDTFRVTQDPSTRVNRNLLAHHLDVHTLHGLHKDKGTQERKERQKNVSENVCSGMCRITNMLMNMQENKYYKECAGKVIYCKMFWISNVSRNVQEKDIMKNVQKNERCKECAGHRICSPAPSSPIPNTTSLVKFPLAWQASRRVRLWELAM